jgi:hypothetical protein
MTAPLARHVAANKPRACKLLVKIYPLQTMKRKIDHAGQRRAATGVKRRMKQKQLSDL